MLKQQTAIVVAKHGCAAFMIRAISVSMVRADSPAMVQDIRDAVGERDGVESAEGRIEAYRSNILVAR